MKKFLGSLAACGLMLSAEAAMAQRDAASKMDGEAFEVELPRVWVEADGMEQFDVEPSEPAIEAEAESVKTSYL